MTIIDDKIKDENCNMIQQRAAKIFTLLSRKIDKYEYLTGEEIVPFNHR